MSEELDRYWWAVGPDGWAIETWRGLASAENVVVVGYAKDAVSAETLIVELNWLVRGSVSHP